MMKIFLIFLFSVSLYAQDVIQVGKGSAKYNWTASSVSKVLTQQTITLRGASTLLRNANGNSTYIKRIRYWSGWDGAKDSTLSPAVLTRIALPEDTLYYDCTITQANGRWTQGVDSFWVNIPPYYYLVSSSGDSLKSSNGDYLVTTP